MYDMDDVIDVMGIALWDQNCQIPFTNSSWWTSSVPECNAGHSDDDIPVTLYTLNQQNEWRIIVPRDDISHDM
jgi:hypothetical protein